MLEEIRITLSEEQMRVRRCARPKVLGPYYEGGRGFARRLLQVWMQVQGWSRESQIRKLYRTTRIARMFCVCDKYGISGVGAYIYLEQGSPVILVSPSTRRRGIGTAILKAMKDSADVFPISYACTEEGYKLAKKVGVKVKRVAG